MAARPWNQFGAFFPGKIQQLSFLKRLAAGGSGDIIPVQHRHRSLAPSSATPGP